MGNHDRYCANCDNSPHGGRSCEEETVRVKQQEEQIRLRRLDAITICQSFGIKVWEGDTVVSIYDVADALRRQPHTRIAVPPLQAKLDKQTIKEIEKALEENTRRIMKEANMVLSENGKDAIKAANEMLDKMNAGPASQEEIEEGRVHTYSPKHEHSYDSNGICTNCHHDILNEY